MKYACLPVMTLWLQACGPAAGPGLEIHDTKYVALDRGGTELAGPEGDFACVLDRYTGLIWEVKTDSGGPRDWRNTYSWWNPDEADTGELDYRGSPDGGECGFGPCDTHGFAERVNAAGLCGYRDWRLPTRDELASISDPRRAGNPPTTNTDFFPRMQAGEYWSGNDYSFQWNAAWLWNFEHGHDRVEWKASPRFVRLVRGQSEVIERVRD